MGTVPAVEPSPQDSMEQRICQVGGATFVAYESGKMILTGGAAVGGGLLAEAPSAGTSTVAVVGGGALIAAGATTLTGSLVYLSEASNTSASGPSERVSKGESKVWKKLKPWRGKTKTNGTSGKNMRYYEWDHTHGDIEVYDRRGRHLGTMDPETGQMTKPAVPGRKIDL